MFTSSSVSGVTNKFRFSLVWKQSRDYEMNIKASGDSEEAFFIMAVDFTGCNLSACSGVWVGVAFFRQIM